MPTELYSIITQFASRATLDYKKGSALAPIIYVSCFGVVFWLGVWILFSDNPVVEIFALSFISVFCLSMVFAYFYFAFTNPDKLQSEEYQLKSEALKMIHNKSEELETIPTDIHKLINPVKEN